MPTYVFPRHVTFTTSTPPSVSCQTIPSRVTDVPGSQGPKHSGSVMVPTLVPTHTSDMSFGSEAEVLNFLAGGGLAAVSMASSVVEMIEDPLPGTAASFVCSGLAAGPAAVALAGLGGGHGAVTEPDGGPDP